MAKIKSKVQLPRLETFEQMEAAFADLATATIRREELTLALELKQIEVAKAYTAIHGEEMERLALDVAANEKRLYDWAAANEEKYFADRRSLETRFGTLKFFKGQPKAECKSKMNWDKVIAAIKACKLADRFLRTKEEPDKEALIAARDKVLRSSAGEFTVADLGVKIVQEETFTIEVKREPVAEAAAEEAA
jgi:phage host-nuclease inhibitor protein Gam